jgi:hypothetical protein
MIVTRRVAAVGSCLILAVFFAIGSLYLASIIRAGEGRDRDLSWAAAGLFMLFMCCVTISGTMLTKGGTPKAKLRMTVLCLAGSGLVAGTVFYGLLSNCHLFQTVKIIEEKRSPDGSLVAVHLNKGCEAFVGYCPSVYQVRLVRAGESPTIGGTLLFEYAEGTDYATIDWKSNQVLQVSCSWENRLKLHDKLVGRVRVTYVTIGIL